MSKQDLLKTQTCTLRVNIDCDGCKRKVRRILQKIDGVYETEVDMQQGKVTVTGDAEPSVLIKKLEKSGKHAELWSSGKGESKSKGEEGDLESVNEQLKKLLQMGNGKGGGNDQVVKKEQQKGGVVEDGKNMQQVNFQQFLEQMRSGSKEFAVKDQKPVKVDHVVTKGGGGGGDFGELSGSEFDDDDDEFDEDDDEFSDEFDEDGEFDEGEDEDEEGDDYSDDEDGDEESGDEEQPKGVVLIKVNGVGKDKKGGGGEKGEKGGGGGGEKAKKSGGIMSMIGKAIGGNNEGKNGNKGKKEGGGKTTNGPNSGSKVGAEGKIVNKSGGGGGGGSGGGGGKKGGGGGDKNGKKQDHGAPTHTKGGGGMGQMGQYSVGPQFPPTPVMNMNGGGGYYQGMGPMGPVPSNPYQQQQYMAMMNQQRMVGGGGGGGGVGAYHPAMYGRPPPGYGYVPPMPPPAYNDHITHTFSDENPGSCSIM